MPETPEELKRETDSARTGNLIIGTKGKMLVEGDYQDSPYLIPSQRPIQPSAATAERSPTSRRVLRRIQGEKPREFSQSNFSYSGPMTANIQLGNLCARAGKKLELDESGKIINDRRLTNSLCDARLGPLEMKI